MSFGERLMDVSASKVIRVLRKKGLIPLSAVEKDLQKIPSVLLSEIVKSPLIRVVGTYSYRDGYLPWCDILALISVLVDRAPRSVLEIGTFNGYTTRLMALNVPEAEIHTLDLPEDFKDGRTASNLIKDDFHLIAARRVGSEYRADPTISTIQQHFGDTATYQFPVAEFFFIDGSHTYSYVRNDTEKALASGHARTLLWHDCDSFHPGRHALAGGNDRAGFSCSPYRGDESCNSGYAALASVLQWTRWLIVSDQNDGLLEKRRFTSEGKRRHKRPMR